MSERPDGYYWVQIIGSEKWEVIKIVNGWTWLHDRQVHVGDSYEIGPPCSRDDSEQLAKAREALGLFRKAFSGHEPITAETAAEIIDESGVRL